MQITTSHMRASKVCIKGAKKFFDNSPLDWKTFVQKGYPEETLASLDHPIVNRVIEEAHGRQ